MEFAFSEDFTLIRDEIRRFAQEKIRPYVHEWDRTSHFPDDIIHELGEMGFLGMTVPPEYQGGGIDSVTAAMVIEELARVCPSIAITISVNSGIVCELLHMYGNEEQKKKYLTKVARGEYLGGLAHTEPGAGSDAGAITSRAERVENGYILNGDKVWVTNAEKSGILIVQAKTNPSAGKRGISSFIVETGWDGVEIGKNEPKLGLHSSVTNAVSFRQVFVPEENRLGDEGMGLRIVLSALDSGRVGVAAQSVGIAQGAFDYALQYATERKTFGQFLAQHQAIQNMLADMATWIESSRWLTYRAAWMKDKKMKYSTFASMAKLYASETAQKVTYLALQIYGSYGYSQEYPVEMYFRDARATTIYEGTSEIQRIVISRHITS